MINSDSVEITKDKPLLQYMEERLIFVMGPWSLMYNLYGVGNLLLDTIIEPARISAFIDQLLPLSIEFAKAQFDAGADIVTWADHITSDLISPKIYEEFMLPAHKKANYQLSGDKKLILHTCGNVIDRLDLIQKAGFDIFHIDSRNDLSQASRIVGNSFPGRCHLSVPIYIPIGIFARGRAVTAPSPNGFPITEDVL